MTDKRPIALHNIGQHHAAAVLYILRLEGGVPTGNFTEKLIEATLVADNSNKERLERGFEGLVGAVRVYKELPHGTEILQRIAAGQPFELPTS